MSDAMMPTMILVGALRYQVELTENRLGSGAPIGLHDSESLRIVLERRLPADMLRSTLLHECLHAISAALGLGLDERTVLGLEHGLDALLVANPGLVALYSARAGAPDGPV